MRGIGAIRVPPVLGLACVLVFAVFGRAAGFPFATWDDPLYVTQNPLVLHPLGEGLLTLLRTPELGYPQPVVVLSYALDHALFGFFPGAFHLENIALHALNVALVFGCARALGLREREAGWGAILFAIHPLVVEPVCWVTGRKDLLATGFTLAAVLLVAPARGRDLGTWGRWSAATALGTLAILSKSSALAVPALLAVTAWAREPRPAIRAIVSRVTPLVVVALGLGVAGMRGLAGIGAVVERTRADVLPDAAGALTIQLAHLVWPRGLVIAYSRLPGDPSVVAMVLASLAVVALGALAWRRGTRVEVWGLAFALLAWTPAAGIVLVPRYSADSYAYLPLAGIAVAFAAFTARAGERAEALVGAAQIGLTIALGSAAFAQTNVWSSPEAVWEAEARRYRGDVYALMQLGRIYESENRPRDAADAFARLDEEAPAFDGDLAERAAFLDRGGRPALALETLARGVEKGDERCVRDYWMALLRAPRFPPPGAAKEVIARAFDLGFEPMKEAIDDPVVFERVAAVLGAAGLDDRAALASAQAAALR